MSKAKLLGGWQMDSNFCQSKQAILRNDTWSRCCESKEKKYAIKSLGNEGGADFLAGHISETVVDHPHEAVTRSTRKTRCNTRTGMNQINPRTVSI